MPHRKYLSGQSCVGQIPLQWVVQPAGYLPHECEVYGIDEINRKDFPVYGEDVHPEEWRKQDDFSIRINQLEELGYKPMLIYYR